MAEFIDYIPEGHDTGTIGDTGYLDFVPVAKPELKEVPVEVEVEKEEPVVKKTK